MVRSLPGLGTILGARVLGEFGDDPDRYASAKSRKNYAGTSPITRASGTKRVVLARYARNMRLADAIYLWAFASLTASPGARAFYDAHRKAGDTHHAALRALGNRLVGILHGCLANGSFYDEHTAWGHRAESNSPRPLDTSAVGYLDPAEFGGDPVEDVALGVDEALVAETGHQLGQDGETTDDDVRPPRLDGGPFPALRRALRRQPAEPRLDRGQRELDEVDPVGVVVVEADLEGGERRDRAGDTDHPARHAEGWKAWSAASTTPPTKLRAAANSAAPGGSLARKRSVTRTQPTSSDTTAPGAPRCPSHSRRRARSNRRRGRRRGNRTLGGGELGRRSLVGKTPLGLAGDELGPHAQHRRRGRRRTPPSCRRPAPPRSPPPGHARRRVRR